LRPGAECSCTTQCGNGCNTATGVCNGLLPNAQPCTAGGQCASNTCAADLNGKPAMLHAELRSFGPRVRSRRIVCLSQSNGRIRERRLPT
jgi:hypothetical protein